MQFDNSIDVCDIIIDSPDELQAAEGNPNRSSWKLNCWSVSEEVTIC